MALRVSSSVQEGPVGSPTSADCRVQQQPIRTNYPGVHLCSKAKMAGRGICLERKAATLLTICRNEVYICTGNPILCVLNGRCSAAQGNADLHMSNERRPKNRTLRLSAALFLPNSSCRIGSTPPRHVSVQGQTYLRNTGLLPRLTGGGDSSYIADSCLGL